MKRDSKGKKLLSLHFGSFIVVIKLDFKFVLRVIDKLESLMDSDSIAIGILK